MSIFTLHVISPLVPIQKSSALWDNCLVYRTSLISNNYLGSNKCSVDNNLHFSRECLLSICFLFRVLSVWNIIQLRMSIFTLHVISAWFLFRKAVLCEITVLSTALLKFLQTSVLLIITYISRVNVLFPSGFLFRVLSVWNLSSWECLSLHFTSFPHGSSSEKQCFVL